MQEFTTSNIELARMYSNARLYINRLTPKVLQRIIGIEDQVESILSIEQLGTRHDFTSFSRLKTLYCSNSTELYLPDSITALTCTNSALTSLNYLPSKLEYLDCSYNSITELHLPDSLTTLVCIGNPLTNLDNLPSKLEYLDCSGCRDLSQLEVPNHLTKLVCSFVPLEALNIPYSLKYLDCHNCRITELNLLNLEYVNCMHNPIAKLHIPSTLTYLDCNSFTTLI